MRMERAPCPCLLGDTTELVMVTVSIGTVLCCLACACACVSQRHLRRRRKIFWISLQSPNFHTKTILRCLNSDCVIRHIRTVLTCLHSCRVSVFGLGKVSKPCQAMWSVIGITIEGVTDRRSASSRPATSFSALLPGPRPPILCCISSPSLRGRAPSVGLNS